MKKTILLTTTDVLVSKFNLTKQRGGQLLAQWITTESLNDIEKLTGWQQELLKVIYKNSINYMEGWNEEELKMKLLSHLFLIADVEEEGALSIFYERRLNAIIDKYELSVVCDCLVAKPLGFNTPQTPYFFLQEFKRQKSSSGDPEGQMLAAMLIAQYKNKDNLPIYGTWLTGGTWFFTVLDKKNYYISKPFYMFTYEDFLQVIVILKKLKQILLQRL